MKRNSPPSGSDHRTPWRGLQSPDILIPAALFAGAVVFRLLFVFSLEDTPFFLQHFSDTRLYMRLAGQINGAGIPHAYFMSPLYPYIIAVVQKITGNPELWVRILQSVFGGTTVLLTYLLGIKLFQRWTGILAAVIVAMYAPLIYYDGLILTESLQTLLLTAHLFFLISAFERRDLWYWIGAGILLGLSVITRASIILFLPTLFVMWLFMRGQSRPPLRNILVYAAATLLLLLPTALHNAATEGVFMPVTSSFGYNLYAGNNANATGLYAMPEGVDLDRDLNGRRWAEQHTGREMNAAEVSAFWRDRAIAWITAHPVDAVSLLGRKFLLFFHSGEIDQLGLSMRFFTSEFGPVLGLPAGIFPALLILAVIGLLLALPERRGGWIPPMFIAVYVFSTIVFFVSGRLRLPLMPVLVTYAAYALVTIVQRSRAGTIMSLRMPVIVGASAVLAVFIMQPEVHQGFEQEYIKLGQAAFVSGDYSGAELRFRASLKEEETVDGLVNLGNALAAQHRADEAAVQYRAALTRDSTDALAWFNFGNLRMQTGSPQYAYGYWKKAVECDPLLAEARRNLGLLLMQAGRLPEAEQQLRMYLELETDTARRAEVGKDLQHLQQMIRSTSR
ncbi:MAG: glycosyltransferase family 39 protein [Bacteroidetes bacterium]|nr:glycosyltransferase family 39 protein [Bacteroidota bacterium]